MRLAADRPLRLAPATASDYRELARRRLPRQIFDYVDGGAGGASPHAGSGGRARAARRRARSTARR